MRGRGVGGGARVVKESGAVANLGVSWQKERLLGLSLFFFCGEQIEIETSHTTS